MLFGGARRDRQAGAAEQGDPRPEGSAEPPLVDSAREESKREYIEALSTLGNLSAAEIRELADYEYGAGATSVAAQVRRYYLKIKSERPDQAERLKAAVGSVDADAQLSHNDLVRVCQALEKFLHGFLLHHNGRSYSADRQYPASAVDPREHVGQRLYWKEGRQLMSALIESLNPDNPHVLRISCFEYKVSSREWEWRPSAGNTITDAHDFFTSEEECRRAKGE